MFERLLVTTDLSVASENLLKCLGRFRQLGAQDVTLIHVADIRDAAGLYASIFDLIRPRMAQLECILHSAGYTTHIEIPAGNPSREIRRVSEKSDYSAVVVGTHGGSLAKDVLLGSVAHNLLETVRKPVFLFPFNILAENEEERCKVICGNLFKHVLFATDFSDTAEKAAKYLLNIVNEVHPEITLFHVQHPPHGDPHSTGKAGEHHDRADLDRLGEMKNRILEAGAVDVHIEVAIGRPAKLIVEKANSGTYSLLVMGNQGHGYLVDTLLGREAHYVVHHADVPLLLVPLASRED